MNATLAGFHEHTAWAWEVSLGRRHLAGELAGRQEDPGEGAGGTLGRGRSRCQGPEAGSCLCRGWEISPFPTPSSSGWLKNSDNIGHINRRKLSCNTCSWGVHRSMKIPKTARYNEGHRCSDLRREK